MILLAACGGDEGGGKTADGAKTRSENGESGLADAGKPVRGGRLVYGLEAESPGGRGEPDPTTRREIYERISRDFAANVWNVWLNYTPWAVALSSNAHGVYAVEYPDGHGTPSVNISRGHPLHGLWIEKT